MTDRPRDFNSIRGSYVSRSPIYVQGMADRDLEGVDQSTPGLSRPMEYLTPDAGRDPKAFLSRHPRIEE